MNQQMWAHPAVQANIETLRLRGAHLLGPAAGDQACGDIGSGRMLEPHELRDAMVASFGGGSLAGLNVLVSAGPTYEDIDPVRFIGNRSSGRMGFAVAQAAALAGARVTLVAGPVSLPTPVGVRSASTCAVPRRCMRRCLSRCADGHLHWRRRGGRLPSAGSVHAQAEKARWCRVVAAAQRKSGHPGQPVGESLCTPSWSAFAAETHDVASYAQDKLRRKGLDMIAANQVGGGLGFEAADNALTLYWADGALELPRASKPSWRSS
jgi:phosphopantothenoylcysteine decarboxylase/phosphopantothenate--cysteine ligase